MNDATLWKEYVNRETEIMALKNQVRQLREALQLALDDTPGWVDESRSALAETKL